MVIKIIVTIALACFGLAILGFLTVVKFRSKEKNKFSFKEAMDLVDLPILTFQVGSSKLNFLLDTGADEAHIATEYTHLLGVDPIESEVRNVIGATGCKLSTPKEYKVTLIYKNNKFKTTLISTELAPLKELKRISGVQVHGILGTKFFKKYKYILNFDEMAAYKK